MKCVTSEWWCLFTHTPLRVDEKRQRVRNGLGPGALCRFLCSAKEIASTFNHTQPDASHICETKKKTLLASGLPDHLTDSTAIPAEPFEQRLSKQTRQICGQTLGHAHSRDGIEGIHVNSLDGGQPNRKVTAIDRRRSGHHKRLNARLSDERLSAGGVRNFCVLAALSPN